MVKEKNQLRVEAGKRSAMKNNWIKELKKTAKKQNIPYKSAMKIASELRKSKIKPKEIVSKKEKVVSKETVKSTNNN